MRFQGWVAVYPPQVRPTTRTYAAPTVEDAARARRIAEALEEAELRGVASLRVDGRLVDYPIYRPADERALRNEACGASQESGQ